MEQDQLIPKLTALKAYTNFYRKHHVNMAACCNDTRKIRCLNPSQTSSWAWFFLDKAWFFLDKPPYPKKSNHFCAARQQNPPTCACKTVYRSNKKRTDTWPKRDSQWISVRSLHVGACYHWPGQGFSNPNRSSISMYKQLSARGSVQISLYTSKFKLLYI